MIRVRVKRSRGCWRYALLRDYSQLAMKLCDSGHVSHQGQQREVRVNGDRAAADGALVRKWLLQGYGIA